MDSLVVRTACQINLDQLPLGSIVFKNNSAYGRSKQSNDIIFRFSKLIGLNSVILRISPANKQCDLIFMGSFTQENKNEIKKEIDNLIDYLESINIGTRMKFDEFQDILNDYHSKIHSSLTPQGRRIIEVKQEETLVDSSEKSKHDEIEDLTSRLRF